MRRAALPLARPLAACGRCPEAYLSSGAYLRTTPRPSAPWLPRWRWPARPPQRCGLRMRCHVLVSTGTRLALAFLLVCNSLRRARPRLCPAQPSPNPTPLSPHPARPRHIDSPLQIAVLKETDGKGTFCSLVMAVVVVKDVLLFAAFAVNVELARAVRFLGLAVGLGAGSGGLGCGGAWRMGVRVRGP